MSQSRVVLENISPEIDAGKFRIKRVVGDQLKVEVDLFADGHDKVNGHLLVRFRKSKKWEAYPLTHLDNDRWGGVAHLEKMGVYEYKILAWVDYALNWQYGIKKKIDEGLNVEVELLDGIQYLDWLIENGKKI